VKQLNTMTPNETSPLSTSDCNTKSLKLESEEQVVEGLPIDQADASTLKKSGPGTELAFQKAISDPIRTQMHCNIPLNFDNCITKSVGTRTFASPE